MKSRNIAFAAGALICTLSAPAVSQSSKDWVDIRNPKELRDLHSNKTHEGNERLGHYRADGRLVFVFRGRLQGRTPEPGTWEIKGEDVCVTSTSAVRTSTDCFRFQRHRNNKAWVTSRNIATGLMRTVAVEEGIPNF